MRLIASAVAATCALVLLAAFAAPSSHAAWPGKPGKVVFKGYPGSDIELFLGSPFAVGASQFTFNGFGSAGDPSWSRDGKRIVFRAQPGGTNFDNEIFVINANGSGQDQLTEDDLYEDDEPNFFPSGNRILFESNRDGDDDLYAMNANGGGIAPLLDTDGNIAEFSAAISPDGKLIAFTSARRARSARTSG